ncbi:hypothetical protein BLS_002239 [Venturia inaequalis]|uniref:RING-type E3 ubiquitin transferase n=1 Tax=Venturia inaequalis TaxID=5025 RepID=A0A8H3VSU1_VENIN|nr:hypothetical protein BLS_002239 [Venturia inaequalis]KAE9993465.1 hypothetical protein EG327_004949 [Venturia inaequalis]
MRSITLLLLSASVALAQTLSPSNSSQSAAPTDSEPIQIAPNYSTPYNTRINLTALTAAAWSRIDSNDSNSRLIATPLFVSITAASLSSIQPSTFALINCDPAPGNLQPIDVVAQAISRNAQAIILFSTSANYCSLQTGSGVPDTAPIYSLTQSGDSTPLVGTQNFSPSVNTNNWSIGKKSTLDSIANSMSSPNNGNYSPGGPTPSTAVAMIILYSITGVITALFLVIIVTGAVRAHRHPERYGPRNVLGRPRQSRARGLARAMLETLPIVKFGEKEEDAKTGDVELAEPSTTHARHVDVSPNPVASPTEATHLTHEHSKSAHTAEKSDSSDIVAAGSEAARASPEPAVSVEEDSLGCSICTDDFEKGQDVRVLPCKHQFHPACIDPWLLNVSGTCPLCRIDLRPVTSIDAVSSPPDHLPPPLEMDGSGPPSNRASRRMSGLWEVLNPRRMAHATPEERIAALRRLREQNQRNSVEELETRRRRRLTARLGETFGVRTRARGTSPAGSAEVEFPATVVENPASPTGPIPGTSAATH